MNQFDVVGMRDFLDSINECCDEVAHSWSIYDLDVSGLKDIKLKLNRFALQNKDVIMSFYSYATGKGRYVMVNAYPLLDIMCKYEEYHDDLMDFIKAILNENRLMNDTDGSALKHVEEASIADEKFREKLFDKSEKVVFSQTLTNLDCIMGVYAFIDKVYDNFVFLGQRDGITSPKLKILIDIYSTSVTAFLRQMLGCFGAYVDDMTKIMNGGENPANSPKDETYRLI